MKVFEVARVNYDTHIPIGIFDDWDEAVLYAKQYSLQLIIVEVANYYMQGSPFWATADTFFGTVDQLKVTEYEVNKPVSLDGGSVFSAEGRQILINHGFDIESPIFKEHFDSMGYPNGYLNH